MLLGLAWFLAIQVAEDRRQGAARERTEARLALARVEADVARLGEALATWEQARLLAAVAPDSSQLGRVAAERALVDRSAAALAGELPAGSARAALAALRDGVAADSTYLTPGGIRERHDRLASAVATAVATAEAEATQADAEEELLGFATWTGGLAVFLLVLVLLMRLVSRALDRVIAAAAALDAGRYGDAALLAPERAPNHEMEQLARSFGRLAESIADRERRLQEDLDRLRELERLKRDFVSTVSHELRTPLTSMRGALGLVLGGRVGSVSARVEDLLRIGMTNTERLIRLINDILDLEKIEAGAFELRRGPVDLATVLRQTVGGLDGLAREAGIAIHLDDLAVASIDGDGDRLIQVFTNLVSNAIRFSPAGSAVEIAVTTSTREATVTVRDHGPGIPAAFADRIFGRFQQGPAPEGRRGGSGLGLSIARALVEVHGGTIGFDDAAGGGTVFWVSLPLAGAATG
jgi:signal transduction histidine kinase